MFCRWYGVVVDHTGHKSQGGFEFYRRFRLTYTQIHGENIEANTVVPGSRTVREIGTRKYPEQDES